MRESGQKCHTRTMMHKVFRPEKVFWVPFLRSETLRTKGTGQKLVTLGGIQESLFATEYKRTKDEGTKCHIKTTMSIKADKTVKEKPSMCHLGRTRREKDEGGV